MENEKYQRELFEFESQKKPTARFGGIFPRSDFALILTPEKMVFAAIGIVMLMVVFFAFGVEKGRSAAYTKFTAVKPVIGNLVAAPIIPAKPAAAPFVTVKSPVATNITPKINLSGPAVKTQAAFDKTKPYTVVAAAFSRKDLALQEIGKLKSAGLEAFVFYGEPYYLACAGSFQNKESAQKILNKVKQMHKDAYVRLR